MQPRINLITSGTQDLTVTTQFYEQGFGFPKMFFKGEVAFKPIFWPGPEDLEGAR